MKRMVIENSPNINRFMKGVASKKQRRGKGIAVGILLVLLVLNVIMLILSPLTPEDREGIKFLLFVFLLMIILITLGLLSGRARRNQYARRYTEYELEQIEQECKESGETWISVGATAVVAPRMIIPTKDIVWVYWYSHTTNFVVTVLRLVIVTRDRKSHAIDFGVRAGGLRKPTADESREFFERLILYRPNVLIGYSKENRKLYKKKNFDKMVLLADGGIAGERSE